jgi:hypothetical protein
MQNLRERIPYTCRFIECGNNDAVKRSFHFLPDAAPLAGDQTCLEYPRFAATTSRRLFFTVMEELFDRAPEKKVDKEVPELTIS